jgi:peptide deformylase
LRNTAREEGAVGLAAQQCGIDASLIFIDNINNDKGIFLVNPRIIHRSPESEMLVWTEECLVLPHQFRAILLRDAEVTIEYEALEVESCGVTKQITLKGELSRCCQHEMDHDRGVLITDHVPLDELLSIDGNHFMADVEDSDGLHSERMKTAYSRYVSESSLLPSSQRMVALATEDRFGFHGRVHRMDNMQPWFIDPVNAMEQEAERDGTRTNHQRKQQ